MPCLEGVRGDSKEDIMDDDDSNDEEEDMDVQVGNVLCLGLFIYL